MSSSRARRLLFSGATVILALVFVLAVGELMARAAGYRMPGVYDADGSLVEPDPVDARGGPFRGVRGTLYHFDFEVPWHNNRDGFRERERTPKADGEWRIGILGDSFAAGYGVELHERVPDLWFEGVRARIPGTTLWNLGANDTGAQHQAELLGGVGSEYALDEIVVLLYSGNEGRDDLRFEKARKREPEPSSPASTGPQRSRRSGLRSFLRSSRLAMLAWTVAGAQLAQRVSRVDAPRIEQLEALEAAALRGLDRLAAVVGERPLTIWYMPSRMEWDDEHWRFMREEQGLPDDSRRFVLRESFEAWANEAGVPFVDLTPALLHQPAELVRFEIDGHYTPEANRRIAQLLIDGGVGSARVRAAAL